MLSAPFVIAIAAAMLLTPVVRVVAARTGAVDRPDGQRKRQIFPVPTLGGLAVLAAIYLAAAATGFVGSFMLEQLPLLISAGLICLVGVYDDIWDLKPRWKLIGQILAILPIVVVGEGIERLAVFGLEIELGLLGKTFMVLWLVSGINAVNLLDGMDGVASLTGVGLSVAAAAIAAANGRTDVALLALIHTGALIGFMVYNLPPARVYLGDSGSMLIGLFVSQFALQAPQRTAGTLNLAVAVALMTVPILDTLLAIIRRTLVGQKFWHGDRRHIHHCLLSRGMSTWKALRLFAGILLVTGFASYLAVAIDADSVAWIFFCLVPAFLFTGNYCCRLEWELSKKWVRRSFRVLSSRI